MQKTEQKPESDRDVLLYAHQTLAAFKPEALREMGLDVLASKVNAALESPVPVYTPEHLEAGACMWEHVLAKLRGNWTHWLDYKNAHGMAALRATVIVHAPQLEAAYVAAVANGYDKDFDWDYVPKYMEEHITRILT